MKKALLILAAIGMTASAFAQGTITYFNRNLTDSTGANYNAFIFRYNGGQPGTVGAGDGFTAGLFLAGAADNATPIATVGFRPSSGTLPGGFATASDVAIPGVAAGSTANLIVRAWDNASGSFAAAKASASGQYGQSAVFATNPLGGPNPVNGQPAIPSPGMGPNFQGFTMVPEPSTIALGVLGIGALFLRRRK